MSDRLPKLLISLFSSPELGRFVRYGPHGAEMAAALPQGVSLATLADAVVVAYESRGMIDGALFDRLLEERPNRRVDILAAKNATMVRKSAETAAVVGVAPAPVGSREGMIDYLVVTALDIETDAVLDLMEPADEEPIDVGGTLVEVALLDDIRVGVVTTGPGNTAAATMASAAATRLRPAGIVFVGVAGGIKDVGIGDVVAGTKVYGYESGKVTDNGFLPRPDVGRSDHAFVQRARVTKRSRRWLDQVDLEGGSSPRTIIAPIAAGEKVVASTSSDVAKRLRTTYGDAVAVEMEGRGLLEAAFQTNVPGLIVRGISDLLDRKAEADESGSQPRAAKNAAAFALEVVRGHHRGRNHT